ncbi:MAG: hypothetical protein ACK54J_23740 [Pseudanabaena sp.]
MIHLNLQFLRVAIAVGDRLFRQKVFIKNLFRSKGTNLREMS